MLVFVIAAIHCQGWKVTKTLTMLMLPFYAGSLAQAIVLELPFETCTDKERKRVQHRLLTRIQQLLAQVLGGKHDSQKKTRAQGRY